MPLVFVFQPINIYNGYEDNPVVLVHIFPNYICIYTLPICPNSFIFYFLMAINMIHKKTKTFREQHIIHMFATHRLWLSLWCLAYAAQMLKTFIWYILRKTTPTTSAILLFAYLLNLKLIRILRSQQNFFCIKRITNCCWCQSLQHRQI